MADSNCSALNWDALNQAIVQCRKCTRLVEWREQVAKEKRRAFTDDEYWGKAVPNFGDPQARFLIVGLAPAAHGANRTGRMFTGDRSGNWLYRALCKAGVANQSESVHREDGLSLRDVAITAVCHCAPPDNKPLPMEIENCRPYLQNILNSRHWDAILALGQLAWQQVLVASCEPSRPKFGHGARATLASGTRLVGSYHPSQQNTFTGKLTEAMLNEAIAKWLTA